MSHDTRQDFIEAREEDIKREILNDKELYQIIEDYGLYEIYANMVYQWVIRHEPENFRDIPPDEYMDIYDSQGIYDDIKKELTNYIIDHPKIEV